MVDETRDEGPAAAIDYAALMRQALLDVVRRAMAQVAAEGLPGEHHFYLTIGTADEGVELPARLRRQFPDEMTIVLQHQYWNLTVDERCFAVTLRFGGAPERLVVPWPALRAFADPSVSFGLRLRPEDESANAVAEDAPSEARAEPTPAAAGPAAPSDAGESPKVVDFGAFRRRSPETRD